MGRLNKQAQQRRNAVRQINEVRKSRKGVRDRGEDIISKKIKENPEPSSSCGDALQTTVNASTQCQLLTSESLVQSSHLNKPANEIGIQVNATSRRKLQPPALPECNEGRRIVNLSSLDNLMHEVSFHAMLCGKGPVQRSRERKNGLQTTETYKCGCGKQFGISSDGIGDTLPINDAIVWGCTQSAVGFTSATKLLATLDLPTPSYSKFKKSQDSFHDQLMDAMYADMKKWAQKEAELAMEAGDFVTVNGIKYPAITVIVDGGWSKRSYKHSFSSNCGVAVIIGARTKKIIYMGTKIRSCCICDRKRSEAAPPHKCYRNFENAPTGMESEIIYEGFRDSVKMYNLVYWKFIGDGDGSVHFNVENVYSGISVEKIECTNHVVRNFTTRLIDISMDKVRGKESLKISLEERRIFNPTVPRFRTGLVQAIAYHHKNESLWSKLYEDIHNMPYHIFGQHDNCKAYFCTGRKEKELNHVPAISKKPLWKAIQLALERPASLAPSLVKKQTSNCAESFMSVACKFVEGKRKNFGQRYLYRLRMAGAVFSYNESSFWAEQVLEILYGKSGSKYWGKMSSTSLRERSIKRKYVVRRTLKVPQLAAPNFQYGDNPQRPDLPANILERNIHEKKLSLQVNSSEVMQIEQNTIAQADSDQWYQQRHGRITASRAGAIYKLNNNTDNTTILNEYFGRRKLPASVVKAMEYGKANEPRAVEMYEDVQRLVKGSVKKAGFVVYQKNGIFGASPDGYIGKEGILEVKCPYSLHVREATPNDWPSISKISSLRKNADGVVQLKENHAHYFQIIMQLYVTDRQWCDYFVWSEKGYFLHRVQRTAKTDELWKKMESKLEQFWLDDLAPELVDSRYDRGYTEYRCPEKRMAQRAKKAAKKKV